MFEGYESASRVTTSVGGSYPQRVSADEDRDERRARLKRIRSILAFAGLYQVTHEMIKQVVLGHVRDHYSWGSDKTRMHYDSDAYKRDVLSKDKSPFRASLLWLVEAGAITLAQADRPDDIHEHGHDLTHKLAWACTASSAIPASRSRVRQVWRSWWQVACASPARCRAPART